MFILLTDVQVCCLLNSHSLFFLLTFHRFSLSVSVFLFQVQYILMWIVTVILLVFVDLYVILSIAYCIRKRNQPQLKFVGEDKSLLSI